MSGATEVVSIVTSTIGSAAIAIALLYSARQTKALQDQLALDRTEAQHALAARRANNDLQLMSHTMALDRIFIEYPQLRPYFYAGKTIPTEEPERARVISTAELIVDLADTVANMLRYEQLDAEDEATWSIALALYGRSPAVRRVAATGDGAWRERTLTLLAIDGETTVHPIDADRRVATHAPTTSES